MGKLLESFSGELGKAWALRLFSPAFVFWLLGYAAVSHALVDLTAARAWLAGFGKVDESWFAPLVVALLTVATSAWLVERAASAVLRLLQGDWPDSFGLWSWRVRAVQARTQALAEEWQDLWRLPAPTAAEVLRRTRLERQLRRCPRQPERLLPTALGNALAATELRLLAKYGLDVVTCWPQLWLLLPQDNRTEIAAARAALDDGVRLIIWSALCLVWTPWAPLLIPVAAVGIGVGAVAALSATGDYADLIEAAFDVRRLALYEALGWPKPATPRDEPAIGQALTRYIGRGSDADRPRFTFAASVPAWHPFQPAGLKPKP